jgi:multiple sugar transport system permease protein
MGESIVMTGSLIKMSQGVNMQIRFSTKQSIYGVCFIAPCVIVMVIMMFYPIIQTVSFSFSSIKLPDFSLSYIGLKNFIRIFSRPEIPQIIVNTLIWTIGSVGYRLILGMITALVMNAGIPGISVLRILVVIPWTVPLIVSANSWRWILQGDFGVINGMLKAWGLGAFTYSWLGNSSTAMQLVLVAATWTGYPFVMMMFLSAMQGISSEYYEAATVDGANALQRFWYITLPCIKPVLLIVLALELINATNAFDMIYIMTGGGPSNATEILGLLIYRLGFINLDFAGASTISVLLIFITILFFIIYFLFHITTAKKGDNII